jgi:hypothetical protein
VSEFLTFSITPWMADLHFTRSSYLQGVTRDKHWHTSIQQAWFEPINPLFKISIFHTLTSRPFRYSFIQLWHYMNAFHSRNNDYTGTKLWRVFVRHLKCVFRHCCRSCLVWKVLRDKLVFVVWCLVAHVLFSRRCYLLEKLRLQTSLPTCDEDATRW